MEKSTVIHRSSAKSGTAFAAAAGVAVVGVCGLFVALSPSQPSSATTVAAAPAGPAAPAALADAQAAPAAALAAPAPANEKANAGINHNAAVAYGKDSALDSGIVVSVEAIAPATLTGLSAGDIAGPGAKAVLHVKNDTAAAIDLGSLVVNATVSGVPISANDAPPAKPLTGTLAPGKSAVGIYVFTLQGKPLSGVTVSVESGRYPNVATFSK